MKFARLHTTPGSGLSGIRFSKKRDGLNDPKEIKENYLHYNEVRGDVLRPPHGTEHQLQSLSLTQNVVTGQIYTEYNNNNMKRTAS